MKTKKSKKVKNKDLIRAGNQIGKSYLTAEEIMDTYEKYIKAREKMNRKKAEKK